MKKGETKGRAEKYAHRSQRYTRELGIRDAKLGKKLKIYPISYVPFSPRGTFNTVTRGSRNERIFAKKVEKKRVVKGSSNSVRGRRTKQLELGMTKKAGGGENRGLMSLLLRRPTIFGRSEKKRARRNYGNKGFLLV